MTTTEFIPTPRRPEASNGHAPAKPLDLPEPPPAEDIQSVPVDQVPTPPTTAFTRITAAREGSKKPIVVPWLRDRGERSSIFRWAIGYAFHVFGYHAIRTPFVYLPKLVMRSPIGAWRVVAWVWGWVWHAEDKPLRNNAVDTVDDSAYLRLKKEWKDAVHRRWIGLAVVSGLLLICVGLWWWLMPRWTLAAHGWGIPLVDQMPWWVLPDWVLTPWWTFILLSGIAVAALGYRGRDPEVPLVSKATVPLHLAPVLRQDVVEKALRKLSCVKKDQVIEFPDPIIRDGPGYLARVILPGVDPSALVASRPTLASGLGRPLGCVWPESGASEHGGLLKLWVGFQDLATARQPAYPLLKGTSDVFKKMPYGTDVRQHRVGIDLFETNILIGAIPGAGKTTSTRTLACGCALDITAEIHAWEFKGSGDMACLEQVAHRYGSGQDNETIRACLADLREIKDDLEKRATTVKRLAKEAPESCPDRKTSRYLADKKRLGLHPVVIFLDEVQNLYMHETYGKEAAELVLYIIRMGRAFGVILIQATQRPDADSLPKAISAQAGIRICLRVMGYQENDMILGTGAYSKGISAMEFTARDKGVGYLVGVGDEPIVAKSYNVTDAEAKQICARARLLREEAGRLSGYAAGVLDENPDDSLVYNLLADVKRTMVENSREWMWSEEIIAALAELRPGHYGGWATETLAKNLTPLGVETGQINRVGPDRVRRNLRGVELSSVLAAIVDRSGDQNDSGPPATGSTAV